MGLKAGHYERFADSMAAAMEDAMDAQWQERYGKSLPREGREDRRILLASIAQGMVGYLKENAPSAFHLEVEATQEAANITSSGQGSGSGAGSWNVSVTQDSDAGSSNRVVSRGSARITDIDVDDLFS